MPYVALFEAYDIPSEGQLQREYYHSEYLSQGQVSIPEGAMTTFALRDLTNISLYDFYLDLKDLNEESETIGLFNPVFQLRRRFQSRPAVSTVGLEVSRLVKTARDG
jgi:hypothetical protein